MPDHQLSLAIGKEGQNARLAARLTGVRIDIRGETQVARGGAGGRHRRRVEYEEGEWVANADTGEMEWHAADGSVITQAEWAAESGEPAVETAEPETAAPETAEPETAEPETVEPETALADEPATADEPADCRRRGRRRTGRDERCWRRRLNDIAQSAPASGVGVVPNGTRCCDACSGSMAGFISVRQHPGAVHGSAAPTACRRRSVAGGSIGLGGGRSPLLRLNPWCGELQAMKGRPDSVETR